MHNICIGRRISNWLRGTPYHDLPLRLHLQLWALLVGGVFLLIRLQQHMPLLQNLPEGSALPQSEVHHPEISRNASCIKFGTGITGRGPAHPHMKTGGSWHKI